MAIDFSKVKDNQLEAYRQSLEKAIGLKEIAATGDELLAMTPAELADRLAAADAELQTRALSVPPPAEPPTKVGGWKLVAEPTPSLTSTGTFDLRITNGKHTLEFLSLSDGGPVSPLEWAAEQAEAFDERSLKIACVVCKDKGEPTRPPEWDALHDEEVSDGD
jgi:hypothetical protein